MNKPVSDPAPIPMPNYNIKTDKLSVIPLLAAEWDTKKNDNIHPEQVGLDYMKNSWWLCPNGHNYYDNIQNRLNSLEYNEPIYCPICKAREEARKIITPILPHIFPEKKEEESTLLKTLEEEKPKLALEWDWIANAPLTPDKVSCYSNNNVGWECLYGHKWKAEILARVFDEKGAYSCPVCRKERRKKKKG